MQFTFVRPRRTEYCLYKVRGTGQAGQVKKTHPSDNWLVISEKDRKNEGSRFLTNMELFS